MRVPPSWGQDMGLGTVSSGGRGRGPELGAPGQAGNWGVSRMRTPGLPQHLAGSSRLPGTRRLLPCSSGGGVGGQ